MNRKAVIFGIKGYKLTHLEKRLLKRVKPWGIILFSRNIEDIFQLKKLIHDIKRIFRDKKYPVLIDQEGGKISRLNKIIDLRLYTQKFFGQLYKKDIKLFLNYYKIYTNVVCDILNNVGININTIPVLDIRRKNTHNFLDERLFSEDPLTVKKFGNLCIDIYNKNKIANVIKHIPGHGLSKSDSHFKTPIVKASKKELYRKDFLPFINSKSFFAMTGHVIYSSFDKNNTATHSKFVINKLIRKYMKFNGLLISDDICMKSLKCSLELNATKALEAGCNLVLHCSGNIKEMHRLSKVIPRVDKFTRKKTSQFYKFLG